MVLLGVSSPVCVVNLLLYQSAEIHSWVELICFGSGIGYEALLIQFLGDLGSDFLSSGKTFMIWAELMPRNLAPCFCSSTVVNGRGFLQSIAFSKGSAIYYAAL